MYAVIGPRGLNVLHGTMCPLFSLLSFWLLEIAITFWKFYVVNNLYIYVYLYCFVLINNCQSRLMVVASWTISLILSLPQAFMFRKLKHPFVEFYQCTTDMVVEEYSSQVVVAGETKYIFLGVDSEIVYSLYHFSFPFFVFFFPLACLIFNYGIIIKMIRR